jgi:hypothetical protein
VITKSQSSKKKTTVLEKNDSQRDFALDRLFKKTSFAFRMLGNKPINIQSLVNKLLPASMAGNIELVESIISYITDNKETLLDEILKAQLDQLLNIGPLRQASRDLFLKDLPPEANKIAIQEWLKRVIQYPLSTNTTFMNALSTYIETHMETIKQQIEAIDEKFSKNTLDFYTYEMLKNPAFQEKFLTIIAEDTQNPLDAFKALVNRMISKNPDPLLEEDIAQYIIANKDVLKEKAREIKILRFIECVNSKDIRKIDLRIKQEVEKTEVEKNDEQFLKDIGDIFRLQSPPLTQNELDLTTKYILENKEEIAELIRIRLKSELRRNMN